MPPQVRVKRGGFPGFDRVSVEASDPEGLREGWISIDGQKQTYGEWDGRSSGSLSLSLPKGEHTLLAKVETVSGVAVFDRRVLIRD